MSKAESHADAARCKKRQHWTSRRSCRFAAIVQHCCVFRCNAAYPRKSTLPLLLRLLRCYSLLRYHHFVVTAVSNRLSRTKSNACACSVDLAVATLLLAQSLTREAAWKAASMMIQSTHRASPHRHTPTDKLMDQLSPHPCSSFGLATSRPGINRSTQTWALVCLQL